MIVLDASAAIDFVVRFAPGPWVTEQLLADDDIHAPHLVDVEVANGLRRLVAAKRIRARRARAALDDFQEVDVARYPHWPFLDLIWSLRTRFTAYDAAYVALARELGATLVTTDVRLARAARDLVLVVAPE